MSYRSGGAPREDGLRTENDREECFCAILQISSIKAAQTPERVRQSQNLR